MKLLFREAGSGAQSLKCALLTLVILIKGSFKWCPDRSWFPVRVWSGRTALGVTVQFLPTDWRPRLHSDAASPPGFPARGVEGPEELRCSKSSAKAEEKCPCSRCEHPNSACWGHPFHSVLLAFLAKTMVTDPAIPNALPLAHQGGLWHASGPPSPGPDCSPRPFPRPTTGASMLPQKTTASPGSCLKNRQGHRLRHSHAPKPAAAAGAQGPRLRGLPASPAPLTAGASLRSPGKQSTDFIPGSWGQALCNAPAG
ncbi:uncharacterized protein LOC109458238 isoform X2 [Rhinolophus sinicus]|uniref:uncharacterized protein LOC109458238 isoform X2 n=1 Tax=Rhinolophus sinicus TaxID=89399 RepID=UPI003D7AE85B